MRSNDIATIVLIVVVSGLLSYFVGNTLIGKPENNPVQIERVDSISDQFPVPDRRVFNDKAIDPAVEINGSGTVENTPFVVTPQEGQ